MHYELSTLHIARVALRYAMHMHEPRGMHCALRIFFARPPRLYECIPTRVMSHVTHRHVSPVTFRHRSHVTHRYMCRVTHRHMSHVTHGHMCSATYIGRLLFQHCLRDKLVIWVDTGRLCREETRNGQRNRNWNQKQKCPVFVFKWVIWKETFDHHAWFWFPLRFESNLLTLSRTYSHKHTHTYTQKQTHAQRWRH